MKTDVTSTFQKRPAYRYIRAADRLPTIGAIEEAPLTEIIATVKLFNPTGAGTWWIAAYDPETGIAYGVAHILEREIGSFPMPELVAYRGRFGLPIERDLHWKPRTLTAIMADGER